MEIYFDKLVTILLAYLNINDRILPEPIFKQIFSLKNSEDHLQKDYKAGGHEYYFEAHHF